MKMTVREICEKLTKIDDAINIVESRIDSHGKQYPGMEPLYQVIDRLKEYQTVLLETYVNVGGVE